MRTDRRELVIPVLLVSIILLCSLAILCSFSRVVTGAMRVGASYLMR